MGAIAYAVTNLITSAATLSSSTQNATYPRTNLYDGILAKPFRFTVGTGGYIEIDFGTDKTPTMIAIMGHNFMSGATMTLKAGASANPSTLVATPLYRAEGIYITFSGTTARYWRLTIVDTNASYTEIGELWLVAHVTLTSSQQWGFRQGREREQVVLETERGVKYVYSMFKRQVYDFTFEPLRSTDLTELRTLDTAALGAANPFLFVPDLSDTVIYQVRKQSSSIEENLNYNTFRYKMQLEEESVGIAVTA